MLVIKIELWPFGQAKKAESIGEIHISNDGTGNTKHGNYQVELKYFGEYFGKPGNWKVGKVSRFLRSKSPYHLLHMALESALFKR